MSNDKKIPNGFSADFSDAPDYETIRELAMKYDGQYTGQIQEIFAEYHKKVMPSR